MTAGPEHELGFTDAAIDRGLAAWFAVRQVRPGRSILRDRMRAAIASAIDAGGLQARERAAPWPTPSDHHNGATRARDSHA